jgi:hypothetical protein
MLKLLDSSTGMKITAAQIRAAPPPFRRHISNPLPLTVSSFSMASRPFPCLNSYSVFRIPYSVHQCFFSVALPPLARAI